MDNEYLAKLLSLKGGSKMKAVYVNTKRQLDMVRKAQAGGFCREVGGCAVPGRSLHCGLVELENLTFPFSLRLIDTAAM